MPIQHSPLSQSVGTGGNGEPTGSSSVPSSVFGGSGEQSASALMPPPKSNMLLVETGMSSRPSFVDDDDEEFDNPLEVLQLEHIDFADDDIAPWLDDFTNYKKTRKGFKAMASKARNELKGMNLSFVCVQTRKNVQLLLNRIYQACNLARSQRCIFLERIRVDPNSTRTAEQIERVSRDTWTDLVAIVAENTEEIKRAKLYLSRPHPVVERLHLNVTDSDDSTYLENKFVLLMQKIAERINIGRELMSNHGHQTTISRHSATTENLRSDLNEVGDSIMQCGLILRAIA